MDDKRLSEFRRHYIFWLDDQELDWNAERIAEEFGYENRSFFHISLATGLTSALQLLEAIRRGYIKQPFDLAVLDVVLKKAEYCFRDIPRSIYGTAPPPLHADASFYVPVRDDLGGIDNFATGFGFSPDEVKKSADSQAGLFVWAWAVRLCPDAHYIIYTALEKVRSSVSFLRAAGSLAVRDKFGLFRKLTFEAQRGHWAPKRTEYESLLQQKAVNGLKFSFVDYASGGDCMPPSFSIDPSSLRNSVVDEALRSDNVNAKAYIIVDVHRPDDHHVIVEYGQAVRLKMRHDARSRSDLLAEFENLLSARIRRCFSQEDSREDSLEVSRAVRRSSPGMDAGILQAILDRPVDWNVKLRNSAGGIEDQFSVPFYLAPLQGRLSGHGREIDLSVDLVGDTYLFATFFLPWVSELMGDEGQRSKALREIKDRFGGDIELALENKYLLPFNSPRDLVFVVEVVDYSFKGYRVNGKFYAISPDDFSEVGGGLVLKEFNGAEWHSFLPPDEAKLMSAGKALHDAMFASDKVLTNFARCEGMVGRAAELHLVIESDRNLLDVPFECLMAAEEGKPETFMVKNVPLTRRIRGGIRAQGGSVTMQLNELIARGGELKVLLIASNVKSKDLGLGNIPGVEEEVRALEGLIFDRFRSSFRKVLVNKVFTDEASYGRIVQELKAGYHIIHFAGHGEHDEQDPGNSRLFFYSDTGGQGDIVAIRADQLHDLWESYSPAFVYLSCCHGADVSTSGGSGRNFIGLAESIIQAGVPTVLSFRWEIRDKSALFLATRFYESLSECGQPDVALRDARRAGWEQKWSYIGDLISPILISQCE